MVMDTVILVPRIPLPPPLLKVVISALFVHRHRHRHRRLRAAFA